jgi:hypothetical protein
MAENTADAPISVPTSYAMKRILSERSWTNGCSVSEIVRQAIDAHMPTERQQRRDPDISKLNKPFLSVRLTRPQQEHLKTISERVGMPHQYVLEALLVDFLFDASPAQTEAVNEPSLFD